MQESRHDEFLTSVRIALGLSDPLEEKPFSNYDALALPAVVAEEINDFLDCSTTWTVESAADAGLVALVHRLAGREWAGVAAQYRLQRFRYGARRAAACGNLALLKWWLAQYLPEHEKSELQLVFKVAAESGHLHVIQWLCEHSDGQLVNKSVSFTCANVVYWLHRQQWPFRLKISMDAAVSAGDLTFMQWIHDRQHLYEIQITASALKHAAMADRLDLLDWLHVNHANVTALWAKRTTSGYERVGVMRWIQKHFPDVLLSDPCFQESQISDLESVLWFMDHFQWRNTVYKDMWVHRALDHLAELGRLDQLAAVWQHRKPHSDSSHTVIRAASAGQLATVQWLHCNSASFKTAVMDRAAAHGHLELVKWLHANRSEGCTTAAMDDAARENHFRVVNWLHEHRTEGCTSEAMDGAAANGHMEMVQWLHKHRSKGCTTRAMDLAAANGELDVVKFLHENRLEGCTPAAMDQAAANGHLEIVHYLQTHRDEGCTINAMDEAATNGHLRVVQFLQQHRSEGCSVTAMDAAAANGHLAILQFLHASRSEGCSTSAMNSAAANGHLRIVHWLHANRSEGCTTSAIESAVLGGHFEVVKFITTHRKIECSSEAIERTVQQGGNYAFQEWLLKFQAESVAAS